MPAFRPTFLAAFLAGALACSRAPAPPPYQDPDLDAERRAADLVSRLTADEKIGQSMNDAPAIPRLGVPAYEWWNECLHGVARAGAATVFPQAIGLAATFDRALMREVATAISDEARAKHHEFARRGQRKRYQGLTCWSPNVNIFRDPRWGRGQETYGEDPYLTARMGVEFVRGLQGDDPRYLKLVATAKHFAVHSGPEADRHRFDARLDLVGGRLALEVLENSRMAGESYFRVWDDGTVEPLEPAPQIGYGYADASERAAAEAAYFAHNRRAYAHLRERGFMGSSSTG